MTLSASASGTSPLIYRWYKDGLPLSNQTNASLTFPNIQTSSEGAFFLVITNSYGFVTSRLASISSALTIEWQQSFGGDGDDLVSVVKQSGDGGYIFGGHSVPVLTATKQTLVLAITIIGL